MRHIEKSSRFESSLSDTIEKYRHNKKQVKKINDDLETVINLLKQDLPIPKRFKDHKVGDDGNIPIRELHLISYGSNCLLMYEKYTIKDKKILFLITVTDHKGMNHILHGFTEDDLLLDEEDVRLVLGE